MSRAVVESLPYRLAVAVRVLSVLIAAVVAGAQ
jgi:hypothetical protein